MMIQTPDIERPPRETIMGLQQIGSATAVGELSRLGIRDAHLRGITSWTLIDGCIRDYPKAKELGIGLWLRGVTPNFHTQTDIFPFAVNVPVACGDTLVMPGDIIIADDDGAVVVPAQLAPELLHKASDHAEWEEFSRMRLSQGGDLRKYYPLSEEARGEYEEWRRTQGA
jgi:regulator of RNase E activity RraA